MKTMGMIGLIFTLALVIIPAWGADFSTYTNAELESMRGTMKDASAEDRDAFRKERQNRQQSMTAEERQKYNGRSSNAPADGSGYRKNAPADGSGYRKNASEGGYGKNQQKGNAGGGGYGKRHRNRQGGGGGGRN
ncbi:MAG: hypothetical protein JRF71_10515 [Deltaproteobacteria bacterium]|nr:hypothetical protein [Deltaproteobacteria bacterium]